ncbi:MAG: 16S rRNA (uracil(1498)-N(3))-methyltransferase [Bacteroidia bacterium]|nr:16S rRNA (uracil(1498)-N(3))-methyltransferase [Bacteroidia bacterium]
MHVFYQPDISNNSVTLSEEESKHCTRVLRLKKGDTVHLTSGRGIQAIASIADDNPKKCVLTIHERIAHTPRLTHLHVAIAPTKNFDRMEWFIEKATEIGIEEITFIECEHSERNKINKERCEKVAVSAMKQSKQWWLPKIHNIIPLKKFIESPEKKSLKLIAWCETNQTNLLQEEIRKSSAGNFTFLIGPEGDFTAQEVELAKAAGFIPVSLGENILRTETAALYGCAIVKTFSK